MTKEEDKLFSEMDTAVTKYKELKKAKEQKKKEKLEYVTKDDMKGLLDQINKGRPVDQQVMQPQQQQSIQPQEAVQPLSPQQPQQRQLTEKEQIAIQIWRDSKTTSIICLIAITFPMISILVAMFPGGAMYALLVALVGILYPCFVFVRMISLQIKLHRKYGLKPLFQFPQQNIPQQRMPSQQKQNNNRGGLFL